MKRAVGIGGDAKPPSFCSVNESNGGKRGVREGVREREGEGGNNVKRHTLSRK